jgi:plastocyanin
MVPPRAQGNAMGVPQQSPLRNPSAANIPTTGYGRQGASTGSMAGYGNQAMSGGSMPGYGGSTPQQSPGYGETALPAYGQEAVGQQSYSQVVMAATLLTALGVPHDRGELRWPEGLRKLAAPGADEMRRRIEALFQYAALQAVAGAVNPQLQEELVQVVKKLRRTMVTEQAERCIMAEFQFEDADRFLKKLEKAEQALAAGTGTPGGATSTSMLSTGPASTQFMPGQSAGVATVAAFDDYFQPAMITVPTGGTVQWTNQGQHRHTVTADDVQWGFDSLSPGVTYSHTFTTPGTYSYHCSVHTGQMRGTVVVK